ncbi:MAG: DUF554 domain-containing protein [Fretibacterium sp.]|nr:DUF554 domain-containing protein [Fretibacterium sp.]
MELLSSLPAGGTLFNMVTVVAGSLVGLTAGRLIPERLSGRVFECMGLFTLYLGMGMAMETKHAVAVLLSLILGTLTGAAFHLDDRLNGLGDTLKAKMRVGNSRFTEGFVTATLLFCIGAMSIVGAFEDGLRHNPSLLVTKGVMDGISSIVLSGSFGVGVLFSIVPMFVYQAGLTLLAAWAEPLLTPDMIANLSGLGGLMIVGIGLNLLKVTKFRLCDMLPGLIFIVFFTTLFSSAF